MVVSLSLPFDVNRCCGVWRCGEREPGRVIGPKTRGIMSFMSAKRDGPSLIRVFHEYTFQHILASISRTAKKLFKTKPFLLRNCTFGPKEKYVVQIHTYMAKFWIESGIKFWIASHCSPMVGPLFSNSSISRYDSCLKFWNRATYVSPMLIKILLIDVKICFWFTTRET